jgi:hypothetical protein
VNPITKAKLLKEWNHVISNTYPFIEVTYCEWNNIISLRNTKNMKYSVYHLPCKPKDALENLVKPNMSNFFK